MMFKFSVILIPISLFLLAGVQFFNVLPSDTIGNQVNRVPIHTVDLKRSVKEIFPERHPVASAHVRTANLLMGTLQEEDTDESISDFPARPPANPFGFTAATTARQCAGYCHQNLFNAWDSGAGTDLPLFNVWDENDEAAFNQGNMSELDPYDTQQPGTVHKMAWQDYEFQRLYHEQPIPIQPVCQRCHIPVAATRAIRRFGVYAPKANHLDAANVNEGVTCVSCHLDDQGNILGPEVEGSEDEGHPVKANKAFLDGRTLCANCHNDSVFGAFTKTAAENQSQGGDSCVDCHMEGGIENEDEDFMVEEDDAKGHAFLGGQSDTFRKRALAVSIPSTLTTGRPLEIRLTNRGAGHNVPTGDTFRAFALKVDVKRNSTGEAVIDRTFFITPLVQTPLFVEEVDYERIDPIGYESSRTLNLGVLDADVYTLQAELIYYQIKPTTLNWRNGTVEIVEAYGVYPINRWDVLLEVN